MVGEDNEGVFACHEAEDGSVLIFPDIELLRRVGLGHGKNVANKGEGRGSWREGGPS